MERSLEQRYAIKFCVRLGKNATETFQMLQKAFKDDCISRSQCGKWHKAFKEGREEVADEPRSGRPTTARTDENVDRVLEVLRTDRRLSIQQIADTLHMSTFVVHGKSPWICKCGQTVNSAFYLEVLRRLKRRIARVRTDIKDTVKLHHDNATSHTAFIIANFLARSNTSVIPHPPYSPDLAPCDFFLFPRLKREMKGKHWETVENIQHHVTTFLRSISVEEFQGAFQALQTRLRKCIDAGGIEVGVPDLDLIDNQTLSRKYQYIKCVREDLRERFRIEYFGCQRQETRHLKTTIPFKVGDMVLIGQESLKRLHWPLARIIQLYPGKDGLLRVAKVKTSSAERSPTQEVRLTTEEDPLISQQEQHHTETPNVVSSYGRPIKRPNRLDLLNFSFP
ncbi:hypothetical protein LAZ67_4001480 [Cordylochernes scorpioides]|uniref:Transposase n=1 Tax=Cordylochernes scorpioides TaxID=51811 RepID=A0ABY6KF00_9ARAC|nr:hypothetical protein LAZ67_4001480 [Cordylochernes scorpioides]